MGLEDCPSELGEDADPRQLIDAQPAVSGRPSHEVRALLGPAQVLELKAGEANLGSLGKHLRGLHKSSGGLQLP